MFYIQYKCSGIHFVHLENYVIIWWHLNCYWFSFTGLKYVPNHNSWHNETIILESVVKIASNNPSATFCSLRGNK